MKIQASIVMATHGTLQNFPIYKKPWTVYVKCLEQYLMTNKIEDADQHRAVLLSVCDPATYRLIRNLVSLKKSTQLKLAEIIEIMQKHYEPKPSLIVKCFHFNKCNLQYVESISMYIANRTLTTGRTLVL